MNRDNNLEKAIKILKSHVPETDNRDTIIENIVSATYKEAESTSSGIFSFIFSWAEYPILRKGLVALSIIMIFVFTGQQILIINRIDNLEGRVVESNTLQLLEHQGRSVLMKSAFKTSGSEGENIDSIMVANKDLRSLIESYTKLQKQYDELESLYKGKVKSKL